MQENLSIVFKEWICSNLKWLIEETGYQSLCNQHFFSYSDAFVKQFFVEDAFSIDKYSSFIGETVQLSKLPNLEISYESGQFVGETVFIRPPDQTNLRDQIRCVTQEFLLTKAHELGLIWANKDEDATVITILAAKFGVIGLLLADNKLKIRGIEIEKEVSSFIIALVFGLKPKAHLEFLQIFNTGLKSSILNFLDQDHRVGLFKNLRSAFEKTDKILLEVLQAKEMAANGYYPLAVSIIENLCRQHPNKTSLLKLLGTYHQKNKAYSASTLVFEGILKIKPNNVYALTNIAFNFIFLKQMGNSRLYLINAHKIDSLNALNLRNIGIYYATNNNLEKAYSYFKKAIRQNENTELVHYYLGIALLQGKYEEAAKTQLTISANRGETIATKKLKHMRHYTLSK